MLFPGIMKNCLCLGNFTQAISQTKTDCYSMTGTTTDLLSPSIIDEEKLRRRTLIPWWIRVFSWIFLAFLFFVPIALIVGIITHNFALSLYGLETFTPYSIIGIVLTALFFLKGIVAIGILRREDWAVKVGIVDAVLGICICIFVMCFPAITNSPYTIRLELFALIPYLIKLLKIREAWLIRQK